MSKTFCQVKLKDISYKLSYLEDRYFPPPWYIHLLYFFLKSTYFHEQKIKNWFNKLSYKSKYISGLHYFFELAISTLSVTLQDGGLIDQVDRERCANRNQSRGIQFIHAKRLTHHPNTRYTLLVMDSCLWLSDIGLDQITDSLFSYTFQALCRTSLFSCLAFSSTPRNLYEVPCLKLSIIPDSPIFIPGESWPVNLSSHGPRDSSSHLIGGRHHPASRWLVSLLALVPFRSSICFNIINLH